MWYDSKDDIGRLTQAWIDVTMRSATAVSTSVGPGQLKGSLPVKHSCFMSMLSCSLVVLMLHASKFQLHVCMTFDGLPLTGSLCLGRCINLCNLDAIFSLMSGDLNNGISNGFLLLCVRSGGSRWDRR